MKYFYVGLMFVLLAGLTVGVYGEKGGIGQIQPFVISIAQAIPVHVTTRIEGHDPLTVTLPLTVAVDLKVRVDAANSKVEVLPSVAPKVAIVAPTATPAAQTGLDDLAPGVARIEARPGQTLTLAGIVFSVYSVRLRPYDPVIQVNKDFAKAAANIDSFHGATVLGTIAISVTNTMAGKMRVDPIDGTVVIGGEQVQLNNGANRYDINGKIFPGVTKSAILYFVLRRTSWESIAKGTAFIYDAGKPIDDTDHFVGDKDFEFTLKLIPAQ